MYLTMYRCRFNDVLNFRKGYKLFNDRHKLLAELCDVFGNDSRQNLGLLYSIVKIDSQYILYVQSKNKPGREVNGFELMDSIDIRHIVSGLETGAIFSFELLTLPFHNKCDKTVTSERKACYKTEQERVSWLKRQGDKYGFELQNVNEHASGRVYFVNRNHKTGKINRGAFMPYLYNGMLVITDGNKFRKAFIDGVGPEKCWGLGMLQLGAA